MQSLASNLCISPKWLLSNAELSRINWRHGSREGELIVEVQVAEDEGDHFEVELGIIHTERRLSGLTVVVQGDGCGLKAEERAMSPSLIPDPIARGADEERIKKARAGITTTQYGFYEDIAHIFYKGKGDTRP